MTDIVETTDLDRELIEKADEYKERFMSDMVKYRVIYMENETNDYPFFLYLASIMNFVEYHNKGCLTEWGMKSLELDVSPFIRQIQTGEPKLSQKDLVKFLLNLLNSYATTFLVKGLFEFSKEEPKKFFELNEFPTLVKEDFEKLNEKAEDLIPKLKNVLDTYTPMLEGKYKRVFLEEKTKGFYKPIFDPNALKIRTNRFPTDLENARECK
jgi:hypothetical protein